MLDSPLFCKSCCGALTNLQSPMFPAKKKITDDDYDPNGHLLATLVPNNQKLITIISNWRVTIVPNDQ